MLKDVYPPLSPSPPFYPPLSVLLALKQQNIYQISIAISAEITSSTTLAEKMNDNFDNTRVRLRGTMNRMLRMAERTGVGWRVWMVFILAVMGVFSWVWLF